MAYECERSAFRVTRCRTEARRALGSDSAAFSRCGLGGRRSPYIHGLPGPKPGDHIPYSTRPSGDTRLVVRMCMQYAPRRAGLLMHLVMEPSHAVLGGRQRRGIAQRVRELYPRGARQLPAAPTSVVDELPPLERTQMRLQLRCHVASSLASLRRSRDSEGRSFPVRGTGVSRLVPVGGRLQPDERRCGLPILHRS